MPRKTPTRRPERTSSEGFSTECRDWPRRSAVEPGPKRRRSRKGIDARGAQEREENRRKASTFESERIAASAGLNAEVEYLQRNLWVGTTLKPGETMEKSLLLDSHHDGDTMELVCPLGAGKHRILFKQVKIRLN